MSASKWQRYPEYKESNISGLGKIPLHWSVERVATLGRISKGSGGSKKDNVGSGLPCIRYGDLYTHHNFVVKDFKTQISAESASRYTTLEKGDIIFAASGELIDDIGKSALFNLDETAYCGGDNIICKTGGTDDSDFLGFATNAPYFAAQKSMVARGYTIIHIYGTQLRDLRLALPPLNERKAISNFISQKKKLLDSQIRTLENLLPLLEEKRLTFLSKAVTKGLNLNTRTKDSGIEWIGDVPEHWNIKRTDWFLKMEKNQVVASDLGEMIFHYSIPSLRDTNDGKVEPSNEVESNKFQVKEKTLLVSKLNPRKGMVLIAEERNIPTICSSEFVPLLQTECSLRWAMYLFQSHTTRQRLSSVVQSATRSHQRARPEHITSMWHAVPPIDEQRKIVEYLDKNLGIMNLAKDNLIHKIHKLKEYRTALISAAVTGKIDVRGLA